MIDTSLPCSVLTVSDIYSQGVYAASLFKDPFAVADLCKRDSFFVFWFLLFIFVCPYQHYEILLDVVSGVKIAFADCMLDGLAEKF